MDNLNDIISSLSNDDINMLKNVASSILGDGNSSNQKNSQNKSSNQNRLNNQIKNSNNNQNNGLGSLLSSLTNNIQNNNSNSNNNNNELTTLNNNQNLNSLGLNANDFNMILKAKNIFDRMNNVSNKNTDLINALKPHLSKEYQNKADVAIKMLKLFDILPLLKDLF